MPSELIAVMYIYQFLRARLDERRSSEAGYSTETVIVTALLAGLALTAVGIIVAKVLATANGISTSTGGGN